MIGRFAAVILALLAGLAPAFAQERHAMVIGIDAYRNVPQLQRAVADARSMQAMLQGLGFRTQFVENPDRTGMSVALARFEESLGKGDTAFVFFAGHGIEIAGQNVLLPADVPDPGQGSAGILRDAGFNTSSLIERITARGVRSAFFVFDACRDNPYARAGNTRNVGATRGLARTEAPEGVFVLMSAGLNQQALDSLNQPERPVADTNPNFVFTRVLLEELARPGLSHIVMAKAVQTRVRDLARSVGHAQVPAFYDQIIGDVILRPGEAVPLPPQEEPAVIALPPAPVVVPPAQTQWRVREVSANGPVFDGIWTRTGPHTLRAEWRQVGTREILTDTIEIESETANAIVLYRRSLNGRYYGTLSADGRLIAGHASWYAAGDRWIADTRADMAGGILHQDLRLPSAPVLGAGTRWIVREHSASGAVFEGVWTRTPSVRNGACCRTARRSPMISRSSGRTAMSWCSTARA
jgi:hypothetical protein